MDKGVSEILLIPLYPQHAMASTETILVLADQIKNEFFPEIEFTNLPAFYSHKDYIRVLSNSINKKSENESSLPLKEIAKFLDYRGKTPPKTESGIKLLTAKNVRMGFIRKQPEEAIIHC